MKSKRKVRVKAKTPIFNVKQETDQAPAEIVMYGDIWETTPVNWWTGEPIEGMHIALDQMLDEIGSVKDAKEVVIRLNSSGGDADVGITIHNLLKGFPGHKTVIVEGLAASAASLIMCAGDTVKVYPASEVMIHNPATYLDGYYKTTDIKTIIKDFVAREQSMKAIYAEKTGKPDDEIQTLIDKTTWMIGQQAVDQGFADELIEYEGPDEAPDVPEVTEDGETLLVAGVGHRIMNLGSVPAWVTGGDRRVEGSAEKKCVSETHPTATQEEETEVEETEVEINSVDQLCAAYPSLTEQLVADARSSAAQAERERIKAIDAIEAHLDPAMVAAAKYDEPMTAADLAYKAMLADGNARKMALADTDDDRSESGADDVDAQPSEGDGSDGDDDEKTIAAVAKMFNSMKKKGVR